MNHLREILRDKRGATMAEYIILIGVVALLAYAGFQAFGNDVKTEIEAQGTAIGGVQNSLGGH